MPETKKKRVRQKPEERLADIINVSRKHFTKNGFEQTSMADVAKEIGIVEGTIYRYFKTKREVLVKAIETWYQEALTDYDENLSGIVGIKNRLRFMIWHHLTTLKKDPELANLMVHHIRSADDYEQTVCFQLNRKYANHVAEVIQEGIDDGSFRKDINITLVRDMIYGGAEYHSWRYVTGRTKNFDVAKITDEITDFIYRSIAKVEDKRTDDDVMLKLNEITHQLAGLSKLPN